MRERIVIATRESKLALWQAHFIRERLLEKHPSLQVELLGMTTKGDRWLSSPLSEVGGKGLFIKELEEAMLSSRADIAVHSMKDVPAHLPSAFVLPLIGYRADVRDALVCADGDKLVADLPQGAIVGSASLRRQAMLLALRPDLRMRPVRGNVGTRLSKLDSGEYDALVLAAAGLDRLGLEHRIAQRLPVEMLLPAAGQGALGVECRADDVDLIDLLSALNESEVSQCVLAERAVSAGLGADCSAPLGAYAVNVPEGIYLQAVFCSADGKILLRSEATGTDPVVIGHRVSEDLRQQGADSLLAELAASLPNSQHAD